MSASWVRHLFRAIPVFLYLVSLLLAHLFFRLVLGLEPKHGGVMGLYGAFMGLAGVVGGIYRKEIAAFWRHRTRGKHR